MSLLKIVASEPQETGSDGVDKLRIKIFLFNDWLTISCYSL